MTDEQIALELQIAAVLREIGMRRRVYPNFVAKNKMTQDKADYELKTMQAVLETLRAVQRDREPELPMKAPHE